jgi:glycosyltransferase involved in cell wall biosynthesis
MSNKNHNNILLVANYRSDVGFAWWLMENYWSQLSLYFRNNKMESFLIFPHIAAIPEIIAKSPITIFEHDFSKRNCASIAKLVKLIKQNNIRYLYLTDKAYYDWFYFILRMFGIKTIINHDHMPGERTAINVWKKYFKKCIHYIGIFSCDYYIGVSNFVRNRLIENACIPPTKCSYIHNGIRIFDNKDTGYAQEMFKIPKNSRIIVTTGRATYYKGIDILIKCANILINDRNIDNLYFLHIGDGPDLNSFKQLASDLNVNKRFIFAGLRNDIDQILPCCYIGIQLSTGEAFSLSILEYMCAGLATLAPNNCGNHEALTNYYNGILYSPGDINEIIDILIKLLANEAFRIQLGKNARRTIINHFSIEECNKKLVALFEGRLSICKYANTSNIKAL